MTTLKDVAKEAEVSISTVAAVLGNRHKKIGIKKETCEHVLAVANKIGYRRNELARTMKTGKSNVIGVIGSFHGSYSMNLLNGIAVGAEKYGLSMKMLPVQRESKKRNESFLASVNKCLHYHVDGVICRSISKENAEVIHDLLVSRNIPVVLADTSYLVDKCSRVISHDAKGVEQVVEMLIDNGCKRIVYVGSNSNTFYEKIRFAGYSEAMQAAGLKVEYHKDKCFEYYDPPRTQNFLKKVFSDMPDAFVTSDPVAYYIMNYAYHHNIRIPEDVQITGFGDLEFSYISSPTLTTARQPFREMGIKAAELLYDQMNGKQEAQDIKLDVELIIRESTNNIQNKEA